jgi:hypothetical protein
MLCGTGCMASTTSRSMVGGVVRARRRSKLPHPTSCQSAMPRTRPRSGCAEPPSGLYRARRRRELRSLIADSSDSGGVVDSPAEAAGGWHLQRSGPPLGNSSRCRRLIRRRLPALMELIWPVRMRSLTSSRLMPRAAATSAGLKAQRCVASRESSGGPTSKSHAAVMADLAPRWRRPLACAVRTGVGDLDGEVRAS